MSVGLDSIHFMTSGTLGGALTERRDYARNRLEDLKVEVGHATVGVDLPGLAIFTVGSYGRQEASPHSDIDLFFIYDTKSPTESRRTNEYKLFGRLIDIVERMEFPDLSNDAQYLESHSIDDVLRTLGSPEDDAKNFFTLRMLMLLESRCVHGVENYAKVIASIVESYYRDYPGHTDSFRPWFLLNDIMRFWKTLLLNYEHRRNRPEDDLNDPRPRVKNFKLKFSRATTCFATICAIGSMRGPVAQNDIVNLVSTTPQERLMAVANNIPSTAGLVDALLADYEWFLEQTALPTRDLQALFAEPASKQAMFGRADAYGKKLYELLVAIDASGDNGLLRALVV